MKEWKIEESDYGEEYWFGGPGQGCIEVGKWVSGGCKDDEEAWAELQKEARLIAASQEMLEALIDVRRALEIANFTGELAVVDAAIKKATK